MCNEAGIEFGRRVLDGTRVAGRDVLEVGSFYGTGPSLRPHVEALDPGSYVGVDIQEGPGVDRLCRVEELAERLGAETFDVVIATELIEHVRDWRAAMWNLKAVLRGAGILVVTTRSKGYPYHGAPYDYWRYEVDDMRRIVGDMALVSAEPDPSMPGVFVAATKVKGAEPVDLEAIELMAMATGRRQRNVSAMEVLLHRMRSPRRMAAWLVPEHAKPALRRLISGTGRNPSPKT